MKLLILIAFISWIGRLAGCRSNQEMDVQPVVGTGTITPDTETRGVQNFIELTKLNASGNFSVELPAKANPARQRYILI